ncbi:MAG: hypothetical protein H6634_18435 [Anaerolineales bacterium]|nr:hypothetical protein [Anaerolineales bacterium]
MKKNNWLNYAGFVYVAAWIIGLLIESGSPAPSAGGATLLAYFTAHRQSHMIQSYLIDGVAGIAILLFTSAMVDHFRKANGASALLQVVLGAGIAATSLSLVQAGFQQALSNPDILATDGSSLTTILVLVNQIDTFKLMTLSVLSGAISMLVFGTKSIPAWLGWLGAVLSLTLVIGGFSFVSTAPVLTYVLFASLPLLLFWVGAMSVSSLRIDERDRSRTDIPVKAI